MDIVRRARQAVDHITLYLGENWPVYAVYAYAKSERETLSPGQARKLARLVWDIQVGGPPERGT